MSVRMWWHNMATGKSDYREAPDTDEEAVQYIPQQPRIQAIYHEQRLLGASIGEASLVALKASLSAEAREALMRDNP